MQVTWLLLALALTLTGVPGGHAEPEVATGDERLDNLLHRVEGFRHLRETLQWPPANLAQPYAELQVLQPDWVSKRQHPGKRDAEEGVQEEDKEEEIVGPKQHLEQWEAEASWPADITQYKRQHPGRRYTRLGHAVTKRQHPGRRLVAPRSWEEGEEEEELMPEKRQHPGKRALENPCGPSGHCEEAAFLLRLLGDLGKVRFAEKRQHPGKRAAREPLEE